MLLPLTLDSKAAHLRGTRLEVHVQRNAALQKCCASLARLISVFAMVSFLFLRI